MSIRIITLIMLFCCSGIAQAQDHREYQDSKDQEKPFLQQEQTTGQEQTRWPVPFNPSQEIGADSQVSFPTDI